MSALPSIDHRERPDRVRSRLRDADIDALLVTDMVDVRWVTGFTGSSGWCVVLPDRTVLGTDGRYGDRARDEVGRGGADIEVVVGASRSELAAELRGVVAGLGHLGADSTQLSHAEWLRLDAEVPLRVVDGAIAAERRRKDPAEIARIARAADSADSALAEVAPLLGDGLSERDVRDELEYRMRRHGADGPSYDTIVASGPLNAARPHHLPGDRRIVEGDTVVIDVGGLVDGYHSDMTRSYVVGEPSDEQREWFDVVAASQSAGLAAVRSGLPARELDATCRAVLADAGLDEWFVHGTGHGVGLVIHEGPFASRTATEVLVSGDVVTVEPGLYRAGFGGLRIEDLVEVTDTGCRVLTHSPKDQLCPPSPPTT